MLSFEEFRSFHSEAKRLSKNMAKKSEKMTEVDSEIINQKNLKSKG